MSSAGTSSRDPGSGSESAPSPRGDHRSLAATLAPLLRDACEERLDEITWFKADWQRGGAATGTSTYRTVDGSVVPVVLKLPVVRRELQWMRRLQDDGDAGEGGGEELVVPRLFASGEAVGGYDLTWIVMERFEHGPLGRAWHEDHIPRVADAAARFHARAAVFEVDQPPVLEPWDELFTESLESVKVNRLPAGKRWRTALKGLRTHVDEVVEQWRTRDTRQWLHGDLHMANAMSRRSMEEGPVSLIDLADVHAGNWVEDAVYLERQMWARPERMKRHKPVRALAAARRRLGLVVEDDYPRLAMIRRMLLAGSAPRFVRSEGHPKHLEACLEWIERGLQELK